MCQYNANQSPQDESRATSRSEMYIKYGPILGNG
jgi:hypothetical protein